MKRLTTMAALSIGVVLLGCTQSASPTVAALLDARLDIAGSVDGGTVVISGSTNLPDGALIFVYVAHDVEALPFDSENHVPVVDGRYEVSVDVARWPPGVTHASATFLIDDVRAQPSHVLAVVGANGERLAGPQTRDTEYGYRLVGSEVIDIPLT
jgi:hypothetical protein